MDEMTLLRDFRSDAPTAAPPAMRARALDAAPTRRRRPALRLAVAAALAVTGGGVAATVLQPASPSAAAVLTRVAATISTEPALTPDPHQWIYQKVLSRDSYTGQPGTHPGESWSRFDGELSGGRLPSGRVLVQGIEYSPLGTPQQWYDMLTGLPDDPTAALSYLEADPLYTSKGTTRADREFDEVTEALTADTYLPPESRSSLFRALAVIPGVGIDEHAAPDLVGRPVLSVTFTGDTDLGRAGDRWELLLDPATYDVFGLRGTAGSDIDLGDGTIAHSGEVWYEDAVLDHRVVDHAGDVS
ncbi:MAG: CU044_5270 family protein [Nocardioides sp.]